MTSNDAIWIGRDGQKFGPYTEEVIRQWLASGAVAPETLGWRAGMAGWQALSTFIVTPNVEVPTPPPPSAPPSYPPAAQPAYDPRASLPKPPTLHWFVVMLLTAVTFGIFAWVWFFVQSSWVKKIDRPSNAMTLQIVALVLAFGGGVINGITHSPGLGALGTLASTVLIIVSYFSMRTSMQADAERRGLALPIGGVTLFFFQTWYLQGQMTWLARWKETGQTTPPPPKAVFWWLALPLMMIPILAAIAIPAYQDYIVRVQVADGMTLGDSAKSAVGAYIDRTGRLPAGNADAGLGDPASIHDKYVSGVEVVNGTIQVTYGDTAHRYIRGHSIELSPGGSQGHVTWRCSSPDVKPQYLPVACR